MFHSNDPCRDWLKLAIFDSIIGTVFWSPFCLFTKICNPAVPSARVRKLLSKLTSPTGIVKTPSSTSRLLVSLDFVRFVMAITGEITGNPLRASVHYSFVAISRTCNRLLLNELRAKHESTR